MAARSADTTAMRIPSGAVAVVLTALATAGCSAPPPLSAMAARPRAAVHGPISPTVDELQHRSFNFFWETANPKNGLVPDRWPTKSFSSIAAVGFALTAYPIGVERGWVTRKDARDRVLTTLHFFADAPDAATGPGIVQQHGFYYHFLDMESGARFKDVELSTIDTTLLVAGALVCEGYFDGDDPDEKTIRTLADAMYRRIDWAWATQRAPKVSMGWTPEGGFSSYDWSGYNEAMILYVMALGSPTHPIDAAAWEAFTSTYRWGTFYGQDYVQFVPLFGYQYSQMWIDPRGISDAYLRGHGIDYFENSRRATLAQRAYAVANPGGWKGYGENIWGLTACDGPLDGTLTIGGKPRSFLTYAARGASAVETRDDGTIAPTAAASSMPFAPEIAAPAIEAMRARADQRLYSKYGFLDAFNPTLTVPAAKFGVVDPVLGWVDVDYLGIDEGPIVGMIENYRTGLVWSLMRKNPYIVRGLQRAGFTGGWLEGAK
jgi:hypothetical protein